MKVLEYSDPKLKAYWIESHFLESVQRKDLGSQTWIVPDLHSKRFLQNFFYKQQGFVLDLQVVRAQELWCLALSKEIPDVNWTSKDYLLAKIRQSLRKDLAQILEIHQKSEKIILEWIETFLPLFVLPQSTTILEDINEKVEDFKDRFHIWWTISKSFFEIFLDKGLLLRSWAPYLLNIDDSSLLGSTEFHGRKILVDLGPNFSHIESELINKIAKSNEVTFLLPNPNLSEVQKKSLNATFEAYENVKHFWSFDLENLDKNFSIEENKGPGKPLDSTSIIVKKYSSFWSEVKGVMSEVRNLLNQGEDPSSICVSSADPELYWPLFNELSLIENIPFEKDLVCRISQIPAFSAWLSRIKLSNDKCSLQDFVQAVSPSSLKVRSERINSELKNLVNLTALAKTTFKSEISNQAFFKLKPSDFESSEIDLETFLKKVIPLFKIEKNKTESKESDLQGEFLSKSFDDFVEDFFSKFPKDSYFDYSDWFFLLETFLVRKEIVLKPRILGGVQFCSISEVVPNQLKYLFVVGASNSQLDSEVLSTLPTTVSNLLSKDYGVKLPVQKPSSERFALSCLLQSHQLSINLSFPMVGSLGNLETPASLLIERHPGEIEISLPGQLNISKMKRDKIQEVKFKHNFFSVDKFIQFLSVERSDEQAKKMVLPSSISVSNLERFMKCPMQQGVVSRYGLKDIMDVEFDLGPLQKGSFLHRILEFVTCEPRRFDFSDDELEKIIEQVKQEEKVFPFEDFIWISNKRRFLQVIKRFLKFEREVYESHGRKRIWEREKEISYYFDFDSKTFVKKAPKSSMKISGRIDRLDTLEIDAEKRGALDAKKAVLLIDYKTKSRDYMKFSNWFKEGNLQLGIYSLALENLNVLGSIHVHSAIYFGFVPKLGMKGFGLKESKDFLTPYKGVQFKSADEWREFLEKLDQNMKSAFQKIELGDYSKTPIDNNQCTKCKWQKLCRATHHEDLHKL